MALKKIDANNITTEELKKLEGVLLNVDNGDLEALKQIIAKWNFKNEESTLRFLIAVTKQAEKEIIYIDQGGQKVGLTPSEDLVNND